MKTQATITRVWTLSRRHAHILTMRFLNSPHESEPKQRTSRLARSRFETRFRVRRPVPHLPQPDHVQAVKTDRAVRVLCTGLVVACLCVLSGCVFNGQSPFYVPKVMTEKEKQAALFRAEANYQMTGKVPDGRLAHIDPKARIKLKPTPGNETIHEAGQEVLTSMPSGGYFAFISQVPITKYFTIVRRADCNEWGMYSPLSVEALNLYKAQIQTGQYRRDKPWYACLAEFDAHYADGDARLKDADGAIFDIDSTRIDRNAIHWTLLSNKIKILMNGWAIKFSDPTPEQINARLEIIPSYNSPIDQLQFTTLIYWIEANKATQYVDKMLALLPINDRERSPKYWFAQDQRLLYALARIAPDSIPLSTWLNILESGRNTSIAPDYPIVTDTGSAMDTAANVIVCRKDDKKNVEPRLTAIITGPYPYQSKMAAARALRTMGFAEVLQKNRGRSGSLLWKATAGNDIYECPFSRPTNAI